MKIKDSSIQNLGYVRNRNLNSGSYEPELTFVAPFLVKQEPKLHLEIQVPVIRTGTMGPEFWRLLAWRFITSQWLEERSVKESF